MSANNPIVEQATKYSGAAGTLMPPATKPHGGDRVAKPETPFSPPAAPQPKPSFTAQKG